MISTLAYSSIQIQSTGRLWTYCTELSKISWFWGDCDPKKHLQDFDHVSSCFRSSNLTGLCLHRYALAPHKVSNDELESFTETCHNSGYGRANIMLFTLPVNLAWLLTLYKHRLISFTLCCYFHYPVFACPFSVNQKWYILFPNNMAKTHYCSKPTKLWGSLWLTAEQLGWYMWRYSDIWHGQRILRHKCCSLLPTCQNLLLSIIFVISHASELQTQPSGSIDSTM